MTQKDAYRVASFIYNVQELGRWSQADFQRREMYPSTVLELMKAATKLHRLNEIACERELTEKELDAERAIAATAHLTAAPLGLSLWEQGDPRGPALYLCEFGKATAAEYNQGVAVPEL